MCLKTIFNCDVRCISLNLQHERFQENAGDRFPRWSEETRGILEYYYLLDSLKDHTARRDSF